MSWQHTTLISLMLLGVLCHFSFAGEESSSLRLKPTVTELDDGSGVKAWLVELPPVSPSTRVTANVPFPLESLRGGFKVIEKSCGCVMAKMASENQKTVSVQIDIGKTSRPVINRQSVKLQSIKTGEVCRLLISTPVSLDLYLDARTEKMNFEKREFSLQVRASAKNPVSLNDISFSSVPGVITSTTCADGSQAITDGTIVCVKGEFESELPHSVRIKCETKHGEEIYNRVFQAFSKLAVRPLVSVVSFLGGKATLYVKAKEGDEFSFFVKVDESVEVPLKHEEKVVAATIRKVTVLWDETAPKEFGNKLYFRTKEGVTSIYVRN